jgi:hypothetical protein
MTLSTEPESTSWSFFMGLGAGGWYKGEMKEVRIYDFALSNAQVASLAGVFAADYDKDKDVDMADLKTLAAGWLVNASSSPATETFIENGNFESYGAAPAPVFANYWEEYYYAPFNGSTSSSTVTLVTNDGFSPMKSMVWNYDMLDTSGNGLNFTEILYTFSVPANFSSYDAMKIKIKRQAGNSQADILYIKILDGGTDQYSLAVDSYLYENEGSTFANPGQWSDWTIDFHNFDYIHTGNGYYGVGDLTNVNGLLIGCYDPTGGTGTISIDDIRLVKNAVCTSGSADLNGDCVANFADFATLAEEWLLSAKNPGI